MWSHSSILHELDRPKPLNLDRLLLGGSACLGLAAATRLADVNAAFEKRTVLDADALRRYITGQRTFTANVHSVARVDIAADLAEHHNLTRGYVRRYLAIAANGDPVAGEIDRSLNLAIDVQ